MKKITSVLLAAGLLLGLTACNMTPTSEELDRKSELAAICEDSGGTFTTYITGASSCDWSA